MSPSPERQIGSQGRAAYPLATRRGLTLFALILDADHAWRHLSRPQREVLLSAAAGAPIVARPATLRRLHDQGLIRAAEGPAELSDAGRLVVEWRPR